MSRRLLAPIVVLASVGCAHGRNYLDPRGPGCALAAAGRPALEGARDSFEVVSFNVKLGRDPEGAARTLHKAGWADADVFVLQEVDWRSAVVMARSLGGDGPLNAVYYPAALHPAAGYRQFGVAILSRWPIRSDQKILLPQLSTTDRSQKVALAATVWVAGVPVGVGSVHLQANLTPDDLERQASGLFACLVRDECPAGTREPHTARAGYVLAGDFNTWTGGHEERLDAVARQYHLSGVEGIRRTFRFLFFHPTLDHLFAQYPVEPMGRGEVSVLHDGSDHHPVRARFRLPAEAVAWQGFDDDALAAGASPDEAVCRPGSGD
jgi:endonuclease/exonuclease/phosphatase family metal-dependent hydrolase